MKKFIYFLIIPIFVLFNDRVFADTVVPTFVENKIGYYLVCNSNNCYLDISYNRSVFIYETDSQLHDYEFKYLSGGSSYRISVGVTDTLPNFNGYQSNVALKVLYETSPVIGNSYTFSTDKKYILMTLTFNVIDNDYGSVEWLGSFVEPEPAHVPVAVIPDTDFYLFYDFDTISDFDIFSDYDFSSFSDYEKVTITIIVNIFYLCFIGFCIYILAKGLYKMVSLVFRQCTLLLCVNEETE